MPLVIIENPDVLVESMREIGKKNVNFAARSCSELCPLAYAWAEGPTQDSPGQASVTSTALGIVPQKGARPNGAKQASCHAPLGRRRVRGFSQGGARYTRLPWAVLLRTSGAGETASKAQNTL